MFINLPDAVWLFRGCQLLTSVALRVFSINNSEIIFYSYFTKEYIYFLWWILNVFLSVLIVTINQNTICNCGIQFLYNFTHPTQTLKCIWNSKLYITKVVWGTTLPLSTVWILQASKNTNYFRVLGGLLGGLLGVTNY